MKLDLPTLLGMARDSIREPRATARMLMAMNLPMQARWLALAATVMLSVLLSQIAVMAVGIVPTEGSLLIAGPLFAAAVQVVVMMLLTLGITHVGRAAGGQGNFADALLLVTWAEFVLVLVQVLQLVLGLAIAPLGDALLLLGVAIFFWLLTWFTAELHGFKSGIRVFLALLAGFFVAGMVLVSLLGSLGIVPSQMGV